MVQQSPMAAETAEIVHRRSDKARVDPTSPLCLGVEVGTDEPVTLSRTERFDPILITGQMGMGGSGESLDGGRMDR